jgi:hypothetical protein
MRIPARMVRRSVAVVGVIALALAYLPGAMSALGANELAACCGGMLCPMHRMSGGLMNCDMSAGHKDMAFQACPSRPPQYTAAMVFNRVAPPIVASERPAGAAPVLRLIASSSLEPEVLSPPPRAIPS